jgi:hypothetical protein
MCTGAEGAIIASAISAGGQVASSAIGRGAPGGRPMGGGFQSPNILDILRGLEDDKPWNERWPIPQPRAGGGAIPGIQPLIARIVGGGW